MRSAAWKDLWTADHSAGELVVRMVGRSVTVQHEIMGKSNTIMVIAIIIIIGGSDSSFNPSMGCFVPLMAAYLGLIVVY